MALLAGRPRGAAAAIRSPSAGGRPPSSPGSRRSSLALASPIDELGRPSSSGRTWSSTCSCCWSRLRCWRWPGHGTGCGAGCRSAFAGAWRARSRRAAGRRRSGGRRGSSGDPVPSWLLFSVTLVVWHIPFAYDATLRSPLVHALEHALFFGTGLLFWTRVIDSPPWRSPLADGARAVYVAIGDGGRAGCSRSFSPSPPRPCTPPTPRRRADPAGSPRSRTSSSPPG